MAVSLIATAGGSAINGGDVTATFTASGAAGDVAYVAVTTRSTVPATILTSGYSQIATTTSGSISLTIWRKVLTGADSLVAVVGNADTGSVTAVSAFIVRGVDNFVPEDIISLAATGSTTNPNPPTVTTVTRETRTLVFAGSQVNDTAVTAPTGYGNLAGASNTDTIPSSCWGAFRSTDITARATAEDPATFTNWNTGNWASFTIVLRQSIATAYWVSGTGSWTTTNAANWASTSGGTGGHIPNAATDVIFDGSSDQAAANFIVTVGAGVTCKNFSTSALESTMTLAGSGAWSIYGNLTIPATNFTLTYTGTATFAGSGSNTITTNGKTFFIVDFNGVGGTWTLQDALTLTGSASLTNGTLALSSYTFTCTVFSSSNSNARTINFGTGKIVITSTTATTVWSTATITNLTTSGTQLVELTGGGANTKTINTGALSEANSISFSLLKTAGSVAFTASNTVRNLTIANNSFTLTNVAITIYGNLTIDGTTPTLTGGANAWTFAATSGTQTIITNSETIDRPITKDGAGTLQLLDAVTMGSTRTFTLTAGTLDINSYNLTVGIFLSDNSNIRRIQTTGGLGKIVVSISPSSATTIWDTTITTNMTTDGNVLVQCTSGSVGNKVIDSGTLSEANAISFQISTVGDGSAATGFTNNNTVKDLLFDDTGYDFTNRTLTIYGNLSLPAVVNGTAILGGTGIWTFASTSGTKTISTGGETLNNAIVFDGVGGAWQLTTSITNASTRRTTLTAGTLDLNSLTWTSGSFSITGAETKVLAHGTGGILNISGAGATAFNNTGSNFSFTGTGTISMNAATAKTFVGNSSSYVTLNQGGAGELTITGSNTFENITNSTQPASVLFTAGTTQTFTSDFDLNGTSGNLITIGSVTPTSTFTLSKSSGTVSVSFCSISDSIASGGAVWEAYTTNGNVDGGNNTGWIFAIVSAVAGAFLMFFY